MKHMEKNKLIMNLLLVCKLIEEQDPPTHEQPKVVNLKNEAPKIWTLLKIKEKLNDPHHWSSTWHEKAKTSNMLTTICQM